MEFSQTRLMLSHFGNIKAMKSNLFSYSHLHANPGSNLTCVEENCHEMVLTYNCSCLRSLPNAICDKSHEIQDPKYIPIVLWSISAFILLLLTTELIAIRFKFSFLDNFFGKLIFSMGIVSSLVTQFCTMHYLQDDSNSITIWYNVVLGVISVFFIAFGFIFFFVRSPSNNIGSHDRGMGLVVAIVSILVVALEIVLIVMVFKRENPSIAFVMYLTFFACEKIVQAALYVAVRRCEPDPNYKRGAVFYFKFLSFLNFTLWLNSIPFTDVPIYDEVSHNSFLHYVDETFKALVIDYRLLCALLFLEHALAIDDDDDAHEHANIEVDGGFQMPRRRVHYTAIGVGIGLIFLVPEVINGADVWHENPVNIFPILVDTALVVLGVLLLRNVNISVLHDKKVSLVFLMVTSMGAASIVYLFCFGLLSLSSFKYDEPVSYVRWSACVFFARATSLLVLLVVYTGIPVSTIASWQNYNRKNYLYVSALCCGLFARFVGSILDEFKGTMHKTAHEQLHSKKLRTLRDLFEIGPLFQLATILHLALHFLLLLWRLHEQPNKQLTKRGRLDAHGEPIGDNSGVRIRVNYGSINGVARQLNGNAHQRFETSGVHSFEGDDDEHTGLLPPDGRC